MFIGRNSGERCHRRFHTVFTCMQNMHTATTATTRFARECSCSHSEARIERWFLQINTRCIPPQYKYG